MRQPLRGCYCRNGLPVTVLRIKPHQSTSLELVTVPTDGGYVVALMDPELERSAEIIIDDMLEPSYKTEQRLPEATDVSVTSRKHHWKDTRLRTNLRAGGSRMHYQQLASSADRTEYEMSNIMLPIPLQRPDSDQMEPTAPSSASDSPISIDDQLPQLFLDQERGHSPSPLLTASEKGFSLPGTSASSLTIASLLDYLNNYPIWLIRLTGNVYNSQPPSASHALRSGDCSFF